MSAHQDDMDFVTRRMKYARGQGRRFMDRVDAAHKECRDRLVKLREQEHSHPEVVIFIAESEAAMCAYEAELKRENLVSAYEDDCSWVDRKQQYAKNQGVRFMDRVTATHTEIRARLDSMESNAEYMTTMEDLASFVARIRSELNELEADLNASVYRAAYEKDVDWVKRQLKYCADQGLRFKDRVEKGHAEIRARLEAMQAQSDYQAFTEEMTSFAQDSHQAMTTLEEQIGAEELLQNVNKDFEFVQRCVKEANGHIPRFLDRAEKQLVDADARLRAMELNTAFFGVERVELFINEWRPTVNDLVDRVKELHLEDRLKKESYDVKSALSSAHSDLKLHGAGPKARTHFVRAQDLLDRLGDDPEFARAQSFLKFHEETCDAFRKWEVQFDEAVLKAEARSIMDSCRNALGSASAYERGSPDRAQEYFHTAQQHFQALRSDRRFQLFDNVDEFCVTFQDKLDQFQEKFEEARTLEKIRTGKAKAMDPLGFCASYLKSNPSQALGYFAQAKEAAAEFENDPLLFGRPELVEFSETFWSKANDFEELYASTVLTDQWRKDSSNAKQLLENSFTYLKSNESQSMDYYHRARSAASDVLTTYPFFEGVDAFWEEFQQRAQTFEDTYAQQQLDQEVRSETSSVRNLLSFVEIYFDRGSTSQALEYLQQCRDRVSALEMNDQLASDQRVLECLALVHAGMKNFEDKYTRTIVRDAYKKGTQDALQGLSNAEVYFASRQDGQALDYFAKAREAAADVAADPRFCSLEELPGFVSEFTARAQAFEQQHTEIVLQDEIKLAIGTAQSHLSQAEQALKTTEGVAIEKSARAREARQSIVNNPRISDRPEIVSFLAEFDARLSTFQSALTDQVLGTAIRDATSKATSQLDLANSYFDSHREEQAQAYFVRAREAAAECASDVRFAGLPEIDLFFEKFLVDAGLFEDKFRKAQSTTAFKKAQDRCETPLGFAETYFDSHRRARALQYLHEAREALLSFEQDSSLMAFPNAQAWFEETATRMNAFEELYTKTVFAEELKSAMDRCQGRLELAQSSFKSSSVDRAADYIHQAREQAVTLGADDRFLRSAEVDLFLNEFRAKVDALAVQIDAHIAEEALRKERSDAYQLLSIAGTYFASHRENQTCAYVSRARDALHVYRSQHGADEWSTEFESAIDSFVAEHASSALNEEVKRLISSNQQYIHGAQFFLKSHARESALESFESAREVAQQLGDERFNGHSAVEEFFSAWPTTVRSFEHAFNHSELLEKSNKLKSQARQRLDQARSSSSQKLDERALVQLTEAKQTLEELRAESAVMGMDGMREFADALANEIAQFSVEFNRRVYADEALSLRRQAENQMHLAETLLQRHAASEALVKYQSTLELVSRLQGEEAMRVQDGFEEALSALQSRLDQFAAAFAAAHLRDEVCATLALAHQLLTNADMYVRRGLWAHIAESVLPPLQDQVSKPLRANAMFAQLPEVEATLQQVADLRRRCAEHLLAPVAAGLVANVERTLQPARKHAARQLRSLAVQALEPVREACAPLLSNDLYRELPTVTACLETTQKFADDFDVVLFPSNAGDEMGALAGSDGKAVDEADRQTIASLLGLGGSVNLKLEPIQLSVSINPKLYTLVKDYNTEAGYINQQVREAVRTVAEIPYNAKELASLGGDLNARHHARHNIETIDLKLDRLSKRCVAVAQNDAPDDEITARLSKNVTHFTEQWQALRQSWDNASEVAAAVGQILLVCDFIRVCVEEGEKHYPVNISQALFGHRANIMGALTPAELNSTEDVYATTIQLLKRVVRQMERTASKWNGFPLRAQLERLLFDFTKRAKRAEAQDRLWKERLAGTSTVDAYRPALATSSTTGSDSSVGSVPAAAASMPAAAASAPTASASAPTASASAPTASPALPSAPAAASSSSASTMERLCALLEELDAEDVTDYVPIKMGDAPVQFRDLPDQSASEAAWTNVCKQYVGEIVFSRSSIDRVVSSDAAFTREFDATDEVHGRAFWPHALSRYPLAVSKKTGEPVYGPERICSVMPSHRVEFVQRVYVDGKLHARDRQPCDGLTSFWFSGVPDTKKRLGSETDFYAFTQTCRLNVSLDQVDMSDGWSRSANAMRRLFQQLEEGAHEVRIDLCARLLCTHDNLQKRPGHGIFPLYDTEISHPLATGSFTVRVSAQKPCCTLGRILPDRCTSLSRGAAATLETAAFRFLQESRGWGKRADKTEVPVAVVLRGDWQLCSYEWFEISVSGTGEVRLRKEATQQVCPFVAFFYRSKATGWERESVAVFHLGAFGPCSRNPPVGPPLTGVSVGGMNEFDVDLLPDEMLKDIQRQI